MCPICLKGPFQLVVNEFYPAIDEFNAYCFRLIGENNKVVLVNIAM